MFELPVIDMRAPAAAREARVRNSVADLFAPFDLSIAPLMRGTLLRVGPREHLLVLAMHHLIVDGWSLQLLFREVAAAYDAIRRSGARTGTPPPLQYGDYAVWQRRSADAARRDADLQYWLRQLDAVPSVLDLPFDRPRLPVPSLRGATNRFTLDGPTTHALRDLSRESGVTPFMTLLTAYAATLYRYSGSATSSSGPWAGRNRPELEPVVGFFANTLVLRVRVELTQTFRTLLRQIREVAVAAYAHGETPFEVLVQHLSRSRDASHNPVFQVGFDFHHGRSIEGALGDVAIKPVPLTLNTAQVDLFMTVEASSGDRLDVVFEYATDLFDAATIEDFAEHFRAWTPRRRSPRPMCGSTSWRFLARRDATG